MSEWDAVCDRYDRLTPAQRLWCYAQVVALGKRLAPPAVWLRLADLAPEGA